MLQLPSLTAADRKHVTGGGGEGGGNKEVINIQVKVPILTLSVMGFEQIEHFSRVFWWKKERREQSRHKIEPTEPQSEENDTSMGQPKENAGGRQNKRN